PLLWVALRPGLGEEVEIVRVTADPYEGEALGENPGDVVEVVAMPVEIQEWVAAFFATHHVEREFFKRQRDRFDPDKMNRGRRPRGGHVAPEDDE
ncbi:MAG: DUF3305 domain-containing protein, partial [Alphaproteobacteria bacterium]|nr:DUF3305 domain-containing protein [Alphaproteobacteria bacterium]